MAKEIKNKKVLNRKQYQNMLDDICSEYCPSGKHCILKLVLMSANYDPRILIQMKCVERHKYELNKTKTEEISWEEAWMSWIEKGYAEKFASVYEEGISNAKIYKMIISND